jgi:sec-independent protein translocase protein TatA
MPNIGPLELIILLVIVLVIFGPKRLPSLGRQLGSGMREFKDSITSKDKSDEDDAPESRAALAKALDQPASSQTPVAAPAEPSQADASPEQRG